MNNTFKPRTIQDTGKSTGFHVIPLYGKGVAGEPVYLDICYPSLCCPLLEVIP